MCLNTLGELDDPKGPLVLGQQALSSWGSLDHPRSWAHRVIWQKAGGSQGRAAGMSVCGHGGELGWGRSLAGGRAQLLSHRAIAVVTTPPGSAPL